MDDSTSPLPPPSGSRRLAVARFVLPVVILIAAFVVHRLVAEDGARRERQQLDARAEGVAESLQRRVRAYGDVLYGVRGIFAASEHVTTSEFHASHVARDVERQYPGVQVVGFADLLPRERVAARTAQIRREVRRSGLPYPWFQIRPAPQGPLVAPITYLEPQSGNEEAFGFDFLSESHRRAALRRTLRSSRPEATAPVRLAQEPGDQSGFLVMLGVQDKRGKPAGVAYAGFRMGELVDRVVPTAHREAGIVIHDLGPVGGRPSPAGRAQRTYDDHVDAEAEADRARRYGSRTIGFDVMGRRWMLRYVPDRSLARDGQTLLNFVPLGLGLAVAALAAWLLGTSLRTERRAVALAERMTETLRTSQTELARSNAELERFAYVASHDLREPLRTVSSFLGLLSRRYDDRLDDDGREFIDLAVQGARRMDTLIAELLEYSRTGRGKANSEPTDLAAAWRLAQRNLSAAIQESGARVTAGPLPVVMADRGEMVQLLQNLLGNAIKYRDKDEPQVRAEAARHGDEWHVSVTDDGPGIDPRHHDRIFVLLQRLHRDDEVEGTGMGLAICKKIVEHHGGRIWVESREGMGARFTFALPAAGDVGAAPAADAGDAVLTGGAPSG